MSDTIHLEANAGPEYIKIHSNGNTIIIICKKIGRENVWDLFFEKTGVVLFNRACWVIRSIMVMLQFILMLHLKFQSHVSIILSLK